MSLSSGAKRSTLKIFRHRGRADGKQLLIAKTYGALWLLAGFVVLFGLGLLSYLPTEKDHWISCWAFKTILWDLIWLLMLRFGWELLGLPGLRNWLPSTIGLTLLVISSVFAFPICEWELTFWAIPRGLNQNLLRGWIPLVLGGWLLVTGLLYYEQKQLFNSFLVGFLIILVSIGSKAMVQFLLGLGSKNYGLCFLWLIATVIAADLAAFLGGIKWGKHKLAPTISPHKTIEGAVCGLVSGLIVGILFSFSLIWFAPFWGADSLFAFAISQLWMRYLFGGLLSLLMVIAALGGDLLFSLVKRKYQKKDFSHLLRGHGGLLDRFDSLLVAGALLFIISFRFANQNFF